MEGLNETKLKDLKATAYNLIRQRELTTQKLQETNEQIMLLEQTIVKEKKEKKEVEINENIKLEN
jgi:hypothetical protein